MPLIYDSFYACYQYFLILIFSLVSWPKILQFVNSLVLDVINIYNPFQLLINIVDVISLCVFIYLGSELLS